MSLVWVQDEEGEDNDSVFPGSPQAMLSSAAQPLSCRGRARYEVNDSADGLQDALPSQVCCLLTSTSPQACHCALLLFFVRRLALFIPLET